MLQALGVHLDALGDLRRQVSASKVVSGASAARQRGPPRNMGHPAIGPKAFFLFCRIAPALEVIYNNVILNL